MPGDTGKMSHLRLEIDCMHEDLRVLVHFASLTDSNAKAVRHFRKRRSVKQNSSWVCSSVLELQTPAHKPTKV